MERIEIAKGVLQGLVLHFLLPSDLDEDAEKEIEKLKGPLCRISFSLADELLRQSKLEAGVGAGSQGE